MDRKGRTSCSEHTESDCEATSFAQQLLNEKFYARFVQNLVLLVGERELLEYTDQLSSRRNFQID
ncbi:MAG: hypothetical protein Rhob2KO_20910 [Rhodopirellula baltica]